MFEINLEKKMRVNSEAPTFRWSCPLCETKLPYGGSEVQMTDQRDLDVQARIHLITGHSVSPHRLVTKYVKIEDEDAPRP